MLLFQFIYTYIPIYIRKMELMEKGNFHLFVAHRKRKWQNSLLYIYIYIYIYILWYWNVIYIVYICCRINLGNRKWKPRWFSLIRLLFAYYGNGSLSFFCLLTKLSICNQTKWTCPSHLWRQHCHLRDTIVNWVPTMVTWATLCVSWCTPLTPDQHYCQLSQSSVISLPSWKKNKRKLLPISVVNLFDIKDST